MESLPGVLQGLGIFIVLVALIGFATAVFSILQNRRSSAKQGVAGPTCSVDADCPEGYVCRNGVCVPAVS